MKYEKSLLPLWNNWALPTPGKTPGAGVVISSSPVAVCRNNPDTLKKPPCKAAIHGRGWILPYISKIRQRSFLWGMGRCLHQVALMKCVKIHNLTLLVVSLVLSSFLSFFWTNNIIFLCLKTKLCFKEQRCVFFSCHSQKEHILLCRGYFEICIHIQGKLF